MKSRIEQRENLVYSLGLLVDPIRRQLFESGNYRQNAALHRARFAVDGRSFCDKLRAFGTVGELSFTEVTTAWKHLEEIPNCLDFDDVVRARNYFDNQVKWAIEALRAVPCEDPDTIFPANSPFQTYLRLKTICSTAGSRVEVFDPYVDASVFHRYLAEVPASVPIVVVAGEGSMKGRRRRELVAVSQLLAAERPTTYRFLVSAGLHDRHLRADSTIYHLGGSLKDAAAKSPFSLSKHTPTETEASLDAIISGAVEWFGSSTPRHRRR